jgi:hypothetical protein
MDHSSQPRHGDSSHKGRHRSGCFRTCTDTEYSPNVFCRNFFGLYYFSKALKMTFPCYRSGDRPAVPVYHAVPVRHHPADVPGGHGTPRPRPATGGCHSPNHHYCRSGLLYSGSRSLPSPSFRILYGTASDFLSFSKFL